MHQVTLQPREPFKAGTWYTARVKGSVTDVIGNPLGADYVFTFKIGHAVDQGYIYLPLARR